jgi:hypothetical protein
VRLVIAAVGKPRDRHLAAAIDEYETRAARYWPLDVVEVREGSGRGVEPDEARAREGERLLERVPAGAIVVACDERGEQLTSPAFATLVNQARESARDIAFVIGGAFLAWRQRCASVRPAPSSSRRSPFHTRSRDSCSPSSSTAPVRSCAGSRITNEALLDRPELRALLFVTVSLAPVVNGSAGIGCFREHAPQLAVSSRTILVAGRR